MQELNSTDRFLIYVVAYEAEQHLYDLFERIPFELFNREEIQFLVNDAGCSDNGSCLLKKWLIAHEIYNVTILKNRIDQGYGGNQKIGLRVAVDDAYSCLILLDGDGSYSPGLLTELIEAWRASEPDILLGARSQSSPSDPAEQKHVDLPVSDRILDRFQNWITGWNLADYQTGCRAYSTKFLKTIPFEINTNDLHFDRELMLQAAHVGARVREIEIPMNDRIQINHGRGWKSSWNALGAILQYKMHQWGMLCSLKLRNHSTDRYRDKTLADYSSHACALKLLEKRDAHEVLDIGCGPGYVARQCEQRGIRVTGIDCARPRPGMMSNFLLADLEQDILPVSLRDYDTLLLLDVIEHLSNPEEFLLTLRNENGKEPEKPLISSQGIQTDPVSDCNQPDSDLSHQALSAEAEQDPFGEQGLFAAYPEMPLLILSTPNVAFAAVRLNLLCGRFNYAERGILDITHKRLFTRRSLLRMLKDCGYDIESVHAVGAPFSAVMPGRMGTCLGWMAGLLAKLWPAMFAFQFMVECRPRPGVREVLRHAIRVHDRSAGTMSRNDASENQLEKQEKFEQ